MLSFKQGPYCIGFSPLALLNSVALFYLELWTHQAEYPGQLEAFFLIVNSTHDEQAGSKQGKYHARILVSTSLTTNEKLLHSK